MERIYYTPKEVADRLKLRVQTVYDYIRQGRLPAVRLGNRCRIAQSDLEAFLAAPDAAAHGAGRARREAAPSSRPLRPATADDAGGAAGGMSEVRKAADRSDQVARNQAARRLLAEWMADESGYDEEVWPVVERLIEENPVSFGEPGHG